MAIENVKKFYEAIAADENLRQRLVPCCRVCGIKAQ